MGDNIDPGRTWARVVEGCARCDMDMHDCPGCGKPASHDEPVCPECTAVAGVIKRLLETGLRAGELAAARWSWVHGQVGTRALRIAADDATGFVPKWGQARAVPLSREAVRWLDEARAKWGDDGYIFSADGLAALGNLADRSEWFVDIEPPRFGADRAYIESLLAREPDESEG